MYRAGSFPMSETKDPEDRPPAPEASALGVPPEASSGTDVSEPLPAADEPPRKKKKRKRKPAEAQPGSPAFERSPLDARGNERPRFLLRFPEDPLLEPLITAFEVGDYARVRAEAPQLIERTDRSDVKRAAEELLRRIEPDPLVKFLLGAAVALFVAVVAYVYYAHG